MTLVYKLRANCDWCEALSQPYQQGKLKELAPVSFRQMLTSSGWRQFEQRDFCSDKCMENYILNREQRRQVAAGAAPAPPAA